MPKTHEDSKTEHLKQSGALNKKHNNVSDSLFQEDVFFDSRDIVQVKYEMLRRVKKDKWSVVKAADKYGLSRFAYYAAEKSFSEQGLFGLFPDKRGPRKSHKMTDEILEFIQPLQNEKPPDQIAKIIKEKFDVDVHPRSIARALVRWKKK